MGVVVSLEAGVGITPLVTGVAITVLELRPDTVSVVILDASIADVPDAALPVDPETDVEAPGTEVRAPDTEVETPDTEVETPDTEVEAPDTEVEAPDAEVEAPDTEVETPDTDVTTPDTDVEIPDTEVEVPDTEIEVSIALLLSEVVVAVAAELVVPPVNDPVMLAADPLPVSVDDPETLITVVEDNPEADAPEGDAVPDGETPDGNPVVEVGPFTSDVVNEPLTPLVDDVNRPLGVVELDTKTMVGAVPLLVVPVELGDAVGKADATLFAKLAMAEVATDTKLEISLEGAGSGKTPPDETGVAVIGAVSVEPETGSGLDTDVAGETGRGVTLFDEVAVAVADNVTLPSTGMMSGLTLGRALNTSDEIDEPVDTGIGDAMTVVGADPLVPGKEGMPERTLVAALESSELTDPRILEDTVSGTTPPLVTGVAGVSRETVERPA